MAIDSAINANAVATAEVRSSVWNASFQTSLGVKAVVPRVAAPSQKTAAKTAWSPIVITNANSTTTAARVSSTLIRRGSHVSRVVMVSLVQSAPPSDAPSNAPSRITNVEIPWKISGRSRSCMPTSPMNGPEFSRQNCSRVSKPAGTCWLGPRNLPSMQRWNCCSNRACAWSRSAWVGGWELMAAMPRLTTTASRPPTITIGTSRRDRARRNSDRNRRISPPPLGPS